MVGLSTAAFLAWHGVPSLAVERHGGTGTHPRAGDFHLRTLEVFRAVGMEDDIRHKSEEQYDSDGGISAIESLAVKEIAKYIPSLNAGVEAVSPSRRLFLTQEALEPILREHARRLGAELRYSTELVGFEEADDGVIGITRSVDSGEERRGRGGGRVRGGRGGGGRRPGCEEGGRGGGARGQTRGGRSALRGRA